MQLPLLGQLSVKCDTVTQLLPPIEFDCMVEGKKLKARITHQEDNGLQFIYHIAFSDGHSAAFVAPLEGGNWHSRDFASPYARAIQEDLHAFCGFVPTRPPFAIRLKSNKEAFNVWVVPHVAMSSHYAVFYKGDYQFDLRKTKQWEAKSVREISDINQEIALLVCKNIERRILQPQLF
jgi:hypothetical protein